MKNIKNGLEDLVVLQDLGIDPNMQLPSPQLVQYYKDENNRIIFLSKDIDESLYDEYKLILRWNREDEDNGINIKDRKPIKIFCHSYGGDLLSCFAFLDLMELSKTPIYTINCSVCYSAAALIFINGHKRFSMPMSTILLHSGSGSNGGQYEAVVAQTENYKKLVGLMHDNILKHSKISKQTLTKNSKKEWYIYSKEAKEKYGLTDVIVSDISEIL